MDRTTSEIGNCRHRLGKMKGGITHPKTEKVVCLRNWGRSIWNQRTQFSNKYEYVGEGAASFPTTTLHCRCRLRRQPKTNTKIKAASRMFVDNKKHCPRRHWHHHQYDVDEVCQSIIQHLCLLEREFNGHRCFADFPATIFTSLWREPLFEPFATRPRKTNSSSSIITQQ